MTEEQKKQTEGKIEEYYDGNEDPLKATYENGKEVSREYYRNEKKPSTLKKTIEKYYNANEEPLKANYKDGKEVSREHYHNEKPKIEEKVSSEILSRLGRSGH